MAALLVARICATVALMGSLHAAVMIGHPELSLAPLPLYFLVRGLAEDHRCRRRRRGRALLCAAATVLVVWAARDYPGLRQSPYAIPVLINLFLLVQFGKTLLPGCEPLIVRYCRADLGLVPAAVERYARRLTLLWCFVFAGMAAECVILAEYASIEVWSLFGSVLNYALVFVLFVGEHAVRSVLFPEYGIASPLRTGRAMLRAGLGVAPGV